MAMRTIQSNKRSGGNDLSGLRFSHPLSAGGNSTVNQYEFTPSATWRLAVPQVSQQQLCQTSRVQHVSHAEITGRNRSDCIDTDKNNAKVKQRRSLDSHVFPHSSLRHHRRRFLHTFDQTQFQDLGYLCESLTCKVEYPHDDVGWQPE
jgi:hypothetical protein